MKKLMVACACILALGMMSCKNTNYCYKLTYETMGVTSYSYIYCTENELDAAIEDAAKAAGIDKKAFNYTKENKSAKDCVGAGIEL